MLYAVLCVVQCALLCAVLCFAVCCTVCCAVCCAVLCCMLRCAVCFAGLCAGLGCALLCSVLHRTVLAAWPWNSVLNINFLTLTTHVLFQFINKFNVVYDRHGVGRRMRGMLF